MGIRIFLKSRKFLHQMLLIVLVAVVLLGGTLFALRWYTYHGSSIGVPNFIGSQLDEVKTLCKQKKLRFALIDSAYVPEAVPGTVIDQYPLVGYRVKNKRMIYLTIAAIAPERVKLPQLIDVSLREAQSRLQNAGLKLGTIEYRASEFFNLVLEQKYLGLPVPDDTLLIKGTAIDLIVGKGLSNEKTQMPDLYGLTIDDAKATLYKVGLNVGALIEDDTFDGSMDSLVSLVFKQSPAVDNSAYFVVGSSVDLYITKDAGKISINEEENIEDADSTGGF